IASLDEFGQVAQSKRLDWPHKCSGRKPAFAKQAPQFRDDGVAAQVGLFEPRRQHIAWHELIILECVQHCLLTIVAQRVNLLVVLACPWLSGLLYGSHDRQHIMSVVLMY